MLSVGYRYVEQLRNGTVTLLIIIRELQCTLSTCILHQVFNGNIIYAATNCILFKMRALLVVCVYLNVHLHVYAVEGCLTVRPTDTAVRAGTRVVLQCSVAALSSSPAIPVKWYHVSSNGSGSSFPDLVFADQTFNSTRYSVDMATPGQFDLVVLSADARAAGKYYCRHDDRDEPGEATADLVVITKIACETNDTLANEGKKQRSH